MQKKETNKSRRNYLCTKLPEKYKLETEEKKEVKKKMHRKTAAQTEQTFAPNNMNKHKKKTSSTIIGHVFKVKLSRCRIAGTCTYSP